MKITVGSKNKAKIEAVREIVVDYSDLFSGAKITGKKVDSGVCEQPKSLEETIQGALNRAQNSFKDCDYSFGLESGITKIPHAKTGWMDFCACAIYDGRENYLGLSSFFEYPTEIIKLVLKDPNLDITKAANLIGFTDNKNIGAAEGVIGILTKKRLIRKDYTKQAITMALVRLENKKLY